MSDWLPQVVAFGITAGLSPIPIIGVVLMLGTPRARSNGIAFGLTWFLSILLVGLALALIAGGSGAVDAGQGGSGVTTWKLVIGVLLIALGVRQWLRRPREGEPAALPGWMTRIDSFNAGRSAALAFALSILNPKNLVLVLGAAAAIGGADLDAGETALAQLLFAVLASLGIALPIATYLLVGDRCAPLLARLKQWMTTNNPAIMLVVLTILGSYLLIDALPSP